eukprot:g8235.t1
MLLGLAAVHVVGVLPVSVPRSAHYAVRQQNTQGGAWSPLFVYTSEASTDAARCGYMNNTRGWTASWVHVTLPAATTAELEVTVLAPSHGVGVPREVRVLPPEGASARVAAGGTVAVTIGTPGQFYIEVNNQMDARLPQAHVIDPTPVHSFHVFVDPDFGDEPGPLSPSPGRVRVVQPGHPAPTADFPEQILYFAPGEHTLPGCGNGTGRAPQPYVLRSNKRYHLAAGAWVRGVLVGDAVDNVTIDGQGALVGADIRRLPCDGGGVPGIEMKGKRWLQNNITVRGITLVDMPGHNLALAGHDYDVSWIKVFSWRINGDGVDAPGVGGSGPHAFRLGDSFLRVQDDALYMEPGHTYERVRIWRDNNGKNFLFGGEVPKAAYPAYGTVVRDCDVLYDRAAPRPDSQLKAAAGIFAVKFLHSFRNLTVANVRVFDPYRVSALFSIGDVPVRNGGPGLAENQTFTGMAFTNVHAAAPAYGNGLHTKPNILRATAKGATIRMKLCNVTVAGRDLKLDWGNATVWDVAGNVSVSFDK